MDGAAADARGLEAALEDADLRVLLMVVYHLTGDARWLAPPYTPARDVRLIADEDAGFPPEIQAEIRAAALAALTSGAPPAVRDPGDELMVDMMTACLGQRTPPEYAPMMREEMGFASRAWVSDAPDALPLAGPVIIVGAGASGMIVARNLKSLGIPFVILEEASEVGGTWTRNTYPGCAVDTPNHAYSFSFGARHDWSRFFSPQPEIHDYMVAKSRELDLRDRIRFGWRVTACDWDGDAKLWRLTAETPEGERIVEGPVLISAIGPLSAPKVARIEGMESFAGPLFHTSDWPEGLDIDGKRVAIIGTGASGLQIAPAIAPRTARLTIFQRTPQWVRHVPRLLDRMSEGQRRLLRDVPFYAEWFRFTMLWRYGDGLLRTLRRDPDWPHPERAMNAINDRHREDMTAHIEAELEGRPDLLAKCVPTYPPFGKRILLDNGWYRTLRRDDVELVTDGVARIAPEGVIDGEGRLHEADVIVMATGFDVTRFAARLNVTGREGRRLADEWAGEDPKAHLGITVPGFPNFFHLQGPATGLAHGGSSIFMSECQSRYIAACLSAMRERGLATLEVRRDVHDAYMARVDAEHRELVWAHPGTSTYYRNRAGRVISVTPWRLVDYWAMTREPDLSEYVSEPLSSSPSGRKESFPKSQAAT